MHYESIINKSTVTIELFDKNMQLYKTCLNKWKSFRRKCKRDQIIEREKVVIMNDE
jgi:hypothetical protein